MSNDWDLHHLAIATFLNLVFVFRTLEIVSSTLEIVFSTLKIVRSIGETRFNILKLIFDAFQHSEKNLHVIQNLIVCRFSFFFFGFPCLLGIFCDST